MQDIKRFPITQRVRVVSGHVSLFTTVAKIRDGLGDHTNFNTATQQALDSLERTRSGAGAGDQCATGLSGEWAGIRVQLDTLY